MVMNIIIVIKVTIYISRGDNSDRVYYSDKGNYNIEVTRAMEVGIVVKGIRVINVIILYTS